jgi:small subunit ribosomal protein S16
MAVRIRLSRIGKKHVPFYRVIAIDSRSKRDGQFLANIATYDGLKGAVVCFDETLYNEWIAKGALPTDSAKKIYRLYKRGQKSDAGVSTPVDKKPASRAKKSATSVEAGVVAQSAENNESAAAKK